VETPVAHQAGDAIDAFLAFRARHPIVQKVSIKDLLEDGRE
jgi:hypothetical protein